MSRAEKFLDDIRNNPAGVRFDVLVACAKRVGFTYVRTKGSHEFYRHPGPPAETLDFQPGKDGKAKPYQVKQFLEALDRLGETDL